MPIKSQRRIEARGVSMNMESSWAAEGLATAISTFESLARFQQKQLQEKEQKLLQLYDQQQQRAHQVAQRGSADSNTSNHGSAMNYQTVTRTTATTRTTSTSQGGKVRQMFDERRQTTVKGIDRSYPLEPLDNKPKKHTTSNGFTPVKSKNASQHSVTTIKRTAHADVNSNINSRKPIVTYHEEVERESLNDNNHGNNEFANENDVEQYFDENFQNRNEFQNDEETRERNRMMAKIHLMDFDKTLKHRVVNDLESEQFPDDLMVDVPDKMPRKSVSKKHSQAELRLERFKNANVNSNKNLVWKANSLVTRKRSDPLLPTQTTVRDSPPTKTRKGVTRSTPEKTRDPISNPTRDKKVRSSLKNLQTSKSDDQSPESFELIPQRLSTQISISTESHIHSNQSPTQSELKSIYLIREAIQGRSLAKENEEEKEEDKVSKVEEKEYQVLWREEKGRASISEKEKVNKLTSKSGVMRKYSIERIPSPAFKKTKTETIIVCEKNNKSEKSAKEEVEKIEKVEEKIEKASRQLKEFAIIEKITEKGASDDERIEIINEVEKRRESQEIRAPLERNESIKNIEQKKRRDSMKIKETVKLREPRKRRESEQRKESLKVKETENTEDEIFIDDHCFRKRDRRKIKDSIRERLNIQLRGPIENKFTLPVKKPVKKKSQDESNHLKISVQNNYCNSDIKNVDNYNSEKSTFDEFNSNHLSQVFCSEKIFERPSDYQEIIIKDQAIDSRIKNTPSPELRVIKSRRQSVANTETISSAAKRKPSLENRRPGWTEKNIENAKKSEAEQKFEIEKEIVSDDERKGENETKINHSKSLDFDEPLQSTELVMRFDKISRSQLLEKEKEEFPQEKNEHKSVKKPEAIFGISDMLEAQVEKNNLKSEIEMKEVEAKMKEVEARKKEVEDKMNKIKEKQEEMDTKIQEVEVKRIEFETKKKEVETKKKEVENKMKEIEYKIKRIGLKKEEDILNKIIKPISIEGLNKARKVSLEFEANVESIGKMKEKQTEMLCEEKESVKKKGNFEKSEDEVDKIENTKYKFVRKIKISGSKISNQSKDSSKFLIGHTNSDNKLKTKYRTELSKSSPIPKNQKSFPKLIPKKEHIKYQYKPQSEMEVEEQIYIKDYGRTDSVESALRRFDSIETDPDFDTSESITNQNPDFTKSKSGNTSQNKKEQISRNKESRKKSISGTGSNILTLQKSIAAAPRNQKESRRISEEEVNYDYNRISAARDSIELTRNFIRTRSPSCKRKLFEDAGKENPNQDQENELSSLKIHFNEETGEGATTILQKKLKVSGSKVNKMEKSFLIEKRKSEKICKTNQEERKMKNNKVPVRKEMRKHAQNQSSIKPELSRVLIPGTFMENNKSDTGYETTLIFRNARTPSPYLVERKQTGVTRPFTRTRVPSSPSKSPDSNFGRGSSESKATDLKSTKHSVYDSPKKRFSQITSEVSKDVIDSENMDNERNLLESDRFETSSTLGKKCDTLVVNFNKSPEIHKPVKKPIFRNEGTVTPQKQNSVMNSVPRSSSSPSYSNGGSAKDKLSAKMRSPPSRGPTPKSTGSRGSRTDCNDSLVSCKVCGRRFASDRIGLHEQICVKAGQKKRKQFDAMKFRVKGTELEPYVNNAPKKQLESKAKKPGVKSNWRRTHEDFINTIRSAKQVQAHLAAGGKLSDLPPPPPSDTSDYIQCPHCDRKFNQSAAERHIPKCETMRHNKPKPRAPPKLRR